MGYYIIQDSKGRMLPAKGKALALAADGAMKVRGEFFMENLVCIVSNRDFDAAIYCDRGEFKYIKSNPDPRPKVWFEYEHAKELSGYAKDHPEQPDCNPPLEQPEQKDPEEKHWNANRVWIKRNENGDYYDAF